MSVGSVLMKDVSFHRDAEAVGDPSSRAQSLEEMRKKLAEQLKHAQQTTPMNAVEEKRQESIQLQLDAIEKQTLSLRRQQPGNAAPSSAPSTNADDAKDSYIRGSFSPSKATGVYSLGMDEDGNPKILFEKPGASTRAPLSDENGAKRSDEAEKETSPAKPSDEEDQRDVAPAEEDQRDVAPAEEDQRDVAPAEEDQRDVAPAEEDQRDVAPAEEDQRDVAPAEEDQRDVAPAEEDQRDVAPAEEDQRDVAPDEKDEDEKSKKASDDKKTVRTGTVDTGKVDAEIRKLKQEKQRIAQALRQAAGDDQDQEALQKRLEAVDSELRVKDTDAYRKQNAEYSERNG